MKLKEELAQDAVDLLNAALDKDAVTIAKLIEQRIHVNRDFEDEYDFILNEQDDGLYLGVLGVVNGIMQKLTGHRLVAVYDDKGVELKKFFASPSYS